MNKTKYGKKIYDYYVNNHHRQNIMIECENKMQKIRKNADFLFDSENCSDNAAIA